MMPNYIKWLFIAGVIMVVFGFIVSKSELTQTGVIVLSMVTVGMWIVETIENVTKGDR